MCSSRLMNFFMNFNYFCVTIYQNFTNILILNDFVFIFHG